MARIAILIFIVLFVGCSKDSHEQLTHDYLNVMDQLVKTCRSIDDAGSAKAEKAKIDELLGELKQLKTRTTELGVVDEETQANIKQKYESQIDSLSKNFSDAIAKIEEKPEVVRELESELKTLASLVNARPIRVK